MAAHDAASGARSSSTPRVCTNWPLPARSPRVRGVRRANGAVADFASGTDYSQVVGISLSAAASSKVRVLFRS